MLSLNADTTQTNDEGWPVSQTTKRISFCVSAQRLGRRRERHTVQLRVQILDVRQRYAEYCVLFRDLCLHRVFTTTIRAKTKPVRDNRRVYHLGRCERDVVGRLDHAQLPRQSVARAVLLAELLHDRRRKRSRVFARLLQTSASIGEANEKKKSKIEKSKYNQTAIDRLRDRSASRKQMRATISTFRVDRCSLRYRRRRRSSSSQR